MVDTVTLGKAVKSAAKIFKTSTVSAKRKQLFSFAKKVDFKTTDGVLNEKGLLLTHLTDYAPKNGYINSFRSATGATRDSVHFSVNHAVQSHDFGDWKDKLYAILMPMDKTLATKGNKFIGGMPTDFCSKGRVRIPKGSVIVRYNNKIKPGTYKIYDAQKIDEFKKLKGIKVIETSNRNMQKVVDDIIAKLGYKLQTTTHPSIWGSGNDGISNLKLFNSFLKSKGFKPFIHAHTPNAKIEMMIEQIRVRADHNKGWQVFDKKGNLVFDYKQEYINVLKYIDRLAVKQGFNNDFNTAKISEILKKSKSPDDALKLIKSEIQLIPMKSSSADWQGELSYFRTSRCLVGGHKTGEITDDIANSYIKNPSIEKFNILKNDVPVTMETISNQEIKLGSVDVNLLKKILSKYGLKLGTTLGTKLYEIV